MQFLRILHNNQNFDMIFDYVIKIITFNEWNLML